MRNYCIIIFFVILLLSPITTSAETVVLKSGKALQGKVVKKTHSSVRLDLFESGNEVTLLSNEIDIIQTETSDFSPSVREILSHKEVINILSFLLGSIPLDSGDLIIIPEDPRWWLLYYYHNKDEENLITYLLTLLRDTQALSDLNQADYFARFFSVTFKENLKKIEETQSIKKNASKTQVNWLDSIINGAQNFKALEADTIGNIELLWADFRATGSEELIEKIVSVLTSAETNENAAFIRKTEALLIFNSLRNVDIIDIIKKMQLSNEILQSRIDAIVYIVEILKELASIFQYRAYNYSKLGQYDEAFATYGLALRICPDYSIVLNNLGNLYKKVKNDDRRYSLYLKAALYNNPEYYKAAYNLGIYFFENLNYDESINYYLRALEYQPNKAEYNHAIGRAYQEKGDVENASKYFRRYLELAPHGEHEQLVKTYLDSVNAPVPQGINDVYNMLRENRYEELETYFQILLTQKEYDENGFSKLSYEIEQLVRPKAMGVSLDERSNILFRWIKSKPQSHFANLVLGKFYIDYAWDARGSGYSSTVTGKGRDLFRERLTKAQECLTKAYELNSSNAFASIYMIKVAMGLGFEFDQMEQWFQRAIKSDLVVYEAYKAKLVYLMPKWWGSREQMFAFARNSAKNAPQTSLIPLVLADAHWEMYWQDGSGQYFKENPDLWRETKEIYERILHDFPSANYHRNKFALAAYYAGDNATARKLFIDVGDKWDPGVWNSKKGFDQTRDKVTSSI